MPLLHRKSLLAVAAVTDVALNARAGPVSGKALAKHHHLRSRHLEPVLQALVREGILKAVRGPGGGYVLAREQRRITADDILRATRTVNDESEEPVSGSALLVEVVGPALAKAENAFSNTLSRITIEDLTRSAALRARKGRNFG
jgi:Rrf2 family protein